MTVKTKKVQPKKFDWVLVWDYENVESYNSMTEKEILAILKERVSDDPEEDFTLYKKFAKIERKITDTVIKF